MQRQPSLFTNKPKMTFLLKINYFLFTILLFIFSCSKEENASFTTFQTPTQDELCGIYFWNQMEGIAVGGNTWTRAIRLSTNDGGLSWKKDSLFDKQIRLLRNNEFWITSQANVFKYLKEKQNSVINFEKHNTQ